MFLYPGNEFDLMENYSTKGLLAANIMTFCDADRIKILQLQRSIETCHKLMRERVRKAESWSKVQNKVRKLKSKMIR